MEGVKGCRVVALNLGATNLDEAIRFWEECFGVPFEDSNDRTSKQLRLGTGDEFLLLNVRARAVDEPHYGHVTAPVSPPLIERTLMRVSALAPAPDSPPNAAS